MDRNKLEISSVKDRLPQGNIPDTVVLNGREYDFTYRSGDITVWTLAGYYNSIPSKTLLLKVE